LENLQVEVPNLPTQTLIASVLSTYDDLIENNEKRIKTLEEMASRLYTEWFVKFQFPGHEKVKMVDSGTEFGLIPEGWAIKKFYDVVNNLDSKRKPISSMKRQPSTFTTRSMNSHGPILKVSRYGVKPSAGWK